MTNRRSRSLTCLLVTVGWLLGPPAVQAADEPSVKPAPGRKRGRGPYGRLELRNVVVIDGTGAPAYGPVDVLIEHKRIRKISDSTTAERTPRAQGASRVIDAKGMYLLPGFINSHCHVGGKHKAPEAEYAYKLWLAHGITSVRCVPAGKLNWALREKARSARNQITAPRIVSYHTLGSGSDYKGGAIRTPEQARKWVRYLARKGGDGIKFFNVERSIMKATIEEAKKLKLGTVAHLTQRMVAHTNALDAARVGLGTLTHFYGLFEALYKDADVQPWPAGFNYSNEQQRFRHVAHNWNRIHPRGSKPWNDLIREFLAQGLTLDPTLTAYVASRDVMRERTAEWHGRYTLPSLWEFYRPSRTNHGSYFFDWTTTDEVMWKNFYRVWMSFLNDYKNAGGRVTVSDDAAFIYNQYGFGYVEEMELLQEAGFHPLEIIRGATLHAAETIFKPKAREPEYGVVRVGRLADLVLIDEDPLANLKVLYGTGAVRMDYETGEVRRVGGVKYVIKDGIVYNAKRLLKDVEDMVRRQKAERGPLKAY